MINEWISPDDIWEGGNNITAIAFFFTEDHKMFLGNPTNTHGDLKRSKEYEDYHLEKYGWHPEDNHPYKTALVGRVSTPKYFKGRKGRHVSFWNHNEDIFNQLLPACLLKLKSLELIDDATYISSVFNDVPITYQDYKKHGLSPKATQANLDKLNADREIHLLKGQDKKQALLNRGVTPKLSPWKDLTPGQKHWAMASEGFKEWLRRLEWDS